MITLSTNRMKIMNALLKLEKTDYKGLEKETKIATTTLKENLYFLERNDVIKRESIKNKNGAGRPKIYWSLI